MKDETTPTLPLIGLSPELSKTFKEDKNKKKEKPSSHYHSQFSSCLKCGSSPQSDNYKIEKDDKKPKGVKVLGPMRTHLTAALDFITYRPQKQPVEYNSDISDKITVWTLKMDVQIETAMFRRSDPISILF